MGGGGVRGWVVPGVKLGSGTATVAPYEGLTV